MNCSNIVIKKFEDKSPTKVQKFLECCCEDFYNSSILQFIINGFIIYDGYHHLGTTEKGAKAKTIKR
ncbi:peptidylprolyl isomerase [Pantoea sp. Nvir]|uniref:peptidylprolyl isomerase n=1 Tax=Pantoea sp. Nvir TaxID=2576760 RepID=UPI0035BE6A46